LTPVRTRLVDVDDRVLARLCGACDDVSTDEKATAVAAADRWPSAPPDLAAGRARPAVLVRPADDDQVAAVLAVCNDARIPVTPAGGRSGVCGGSIPLHGGVSLDLSRLDGDAVIDDTSLVADVPAGVFGPALEDGLRAAGLTLGHWPQSMAISTVGGWLACRSAGQYSTRYGKIEDLTVGLRVALADGRLIRTGGHPRAAIGPDLTQVFLGSEGTLGVITSARLRLRPAPADERRAVYLFDAFAAGLDACRRVLRRAATPAALRLYDPADARLAFGDTEGVVLVVVDEGDPVTLDASMRVVDEECAATGARRLDDDALAQRWLAARQHLVTFAELGFVGDTVEVAATWAALPALYEDMRTALARVEHVTWVSAHQSHAYADGACIYVTFAGQPPAEAAESFCLQAWDVAVAAARCHRAALSHHHGIGLAKARYLAETLGSAFPVLVAIKQALDPNGVLNPGKLGLPDPFGPVAWTP
jgi:alkyldihydroxyacetonephosphate synthase